MLLSCSLFFIFFIRLTLITFFSFFFFNDTATTEIYTLSLHDALPISCPPSSPLHLPTWSELPSARFPCGVRSEEHTSELQSHLNLVCRLLLEKKKKTNKYEHNQIKAYTCQAKQ